MTAKQATKIERCVNEIEECINADSAVWNTVGWETLVDDIDLMIEAKQAEIAKLRKARKTAMENAAKCKVFPWDDYSPKRKDQDASRKAS
jgi:hypothetical protein